jgi:hypothetical protein
MKQRLTDTLVSINAAFKVAVRLVSKSYLTTNTERCV